MSRRCIQVLDERREISHVFPDMPLPGRGRAPAVSPAVVRDHPKVFRQVGDDEVPDGVVAPGTVYQDERRTLSSFFVKEIDPIQHGSCHRLFLPKLFPGNCAPIEVAVKPEDRAATAPFLMDALGGASGLEGANTTCPGQIRELRLARAATSCPEFRFRALR